MVFVKNHQYFAALHEGAKLDKSRNSIEENPYLSVTITKGSTLEITWSPKSQADNVKTINFYPKTPSRARRGQNFADYISN